MWFGSALAFERQMIPSKQSISHRPETKTVTDIQNLFDDNLLNLEPGFSANRFGLNAIASS